MTRAKTVLAITILAVLALLAAGPAAAGSPPLGKYDCTIGSDNILFGTIAILTGGRYTKDGTRGTFVAGAATIRFKDGVSGSTLLFKSGALNNIKGRWYRNKGSSRTYEIALRNPKDGYESIYCGKSN